MILLDTNICIHIINAILPFDETVLWVYGDRRSQHVGDQQPRCVRANSRSSARQLGSQPVVTQIVLVQAEDGWLA